MVYAIATTGWAGTWLPPIVTILGVMLTAAVTVGVAFAQMKRQAQQNRDNRLIETKREVLLDAVKGMYEAHAAYGQLTNLAIPHGDILIKFQGGMAKVATASAVANVEAVKAGRELSQVLAPIFMKLFATRMKLSELLDKGELNGMAVKAFALEVLAPLERISRAQIEVLAAIRRDIDIDDDVSPDQFRAAATPDFKLISATIAEALEGI